MVYNTNISYNIINILVYNPRRLIMAYQLDRPTAQQIAETVRSVCGHDINLIQPSGIIYASTNKNRIGDYHEIGRQSAETKKTIEVREGEHFHGTQEGVNLPFLWNGEVICVIGITGNPDEVRNYAILARRIAGLILRERELDFRDRTRKNQMAYVVISLISNEPGNHQFINNFLASQKIDTKDSYRTVIIQVNTEEKTTASDIYEEQISAFADRIRPSLSMFRYPDEYILIFTEKNFQEREYLLKAYEEQRFPVHIGVGTASTLFRQHRSYREAKLALSSGTGQIRYHRYEDLDLSPLLASSSAEARELITKKTTVKLSPLDLQCLKAYFENRCSVTAAANELFLHKNTLQYHLDRVMKLTGYNPRVFTDAVILYLGLKLQ